MDKPPPQLRNPNRRYTVSDLIPVVVVGDDTELEIRWPDPRPDSFPMSSDVFESMVDEINSYRRADFHRRNTVPREPTTPNPGITEKGPQP